MDGFSAAPGFWYTIDTARARYARSAPPPVPSEVADDGQRSSRLATARLADEPVRLARCDLQRDAPKHGSVDPAHAVGDIQVAELERELGHRSSTCCTESETRFTATTSDAIAIAGNRTVHHSNARSW